jgi:hypothetical protein
MTDWEEVEHQYRKNQEELPFEEWFPHEVEEAVQEQYDPFAPENVGAVQLIVQMRIYDVLMAMYTEQNPGKANILINLHEQGKILGPLPAIDLSNKENE